MSYGHSKEKYSSYITLFGDISLGILVYYLLFYLMASSNNQNNIKKCKEKENIHTCISSLFNLLA